MDEHRIYGYSFASVYPHYVAKAERKGRTKAEVDEIIRWLTGYSQKELEVQIATKADLRAFYGDAPALNVARDARVPMIVETAEGFGEIDLVDCHGAGARKIFSIAFPFASSSISLSR